MFILVDDKNRENEGDLVYPGQMQFKNNKFYGQTWKRFDLLGTYKKTSR